MANDIDQDASYKQEMEKYCKDLTDILNKSNDQFEKQLSYISAGALGLSFILIEKVLKDVYITHYKGLLIVGWSLLTVTLLINLLSHIYAAHVHYKTLEQVNTFLAGGDLFNPNRGDKY